MLPQQPTRRAAALHSRCQERTRSVAAAADSRLMVVHGAPLVLKMDNGSALIGWAVRTLLGAWSVAMLRSPVRTPSYNGSCEAGIGSLSAAIDRHARAHGRAATWTCDDVEAARRERNALARSPLDPSRSPDEVWAARTAISAAERAEFWARCHGHARRERELSELPAGRPANRNEQASIDRTALGRALIEADYLEVRWRSIPPPI